MYIFMISENSYFTTASADWSWNHRESHIMHEDITASNFVKYLITINIHGKMSEFLSIAPVECEGHSFISMHKGSTLGGITCVDASICWSVKPFRSCNLSVLIEML